MIVDASALLAVAFREPDAGIYGRALLRAPALRVPAPTWFEAATVIDRRGNDRATRIFEEIVGDLGIEIAAFGPSHAARARLAWHCYGRGTGHPAKLNFGDCMVYGFARAENEPLLFKGNDFIHTDIEPALKD